MTGRMCWWVDAWMDDWMDGLDGWMDGWMDRLSAEFCHILVDLIPTAWTPFDSSWPYLFFLVSPDTVEIDLFVRSSDEKDLNIAEMLVNEGLAVSAALPAHPDIQGSSAPKLKRLAGNSRAHKEDVRCIREQVSAKGTGELCEHAALISYCMSSFPPPSLLHLPPYEFVSTPSLALIKGIIKVQRKLRQYRCVWFPMASSVNHEVLFSGSETIKYCTIGVEELCVLLAANWVCAE